MSSSSDFELIHGQLHVTKDPSKPEALGRGPASIRGAAYMQGPTIVGKDDVFKNVEAPLMVGPIENTDSPVPWVCEPLYFCGKRLKNPYSLVVRQDIHTTNPLKCTVGVGKGSKVTSGKGAALFIGDVDIYGFTRVKKDLVADGHVKSHCGSHVLHVKKDFDIPHPTKEGWRLTHACAEGPEAAVYIRGRVKNKTEIELPEYWKGLVDIDTITVNLTPIGAHQDVIIKRWDDEKVHLQSKGGMPIDCFYHIMAERKDTEKLIPEYQGTIEDYPGDNSQRSIAGYHYDVKESN